MGKVKRVGRLFVVTHNPKKSVPALSYYPIYRADCPTAISVLVSFVKDRFKSSSRALLKVYFLLIPYLLYSTLII